MATISEILNIDNLLEDNEGFKWVQVSSSTVASIGYNDDLETMRVSFYETGTYEYYDVPESVFEDFVASASKGRYMHYVVKPRYAYSFIG